MLKAFGSVNDDCIFIKMIIINVRFMLSVAFVEYKFVLLLMDYVNL